MEWNAKTGKEQTKLNQFNNSEKNKNKKIYDLNYLNTEIYIHISCKTQTNNKPIERNGII